MTTTLEAYWDRFADGQTINADHAFGWTQYPGHGPGEELLDGPGSALELGCGFGGDTAYLARKGVRAVGVDMSGRQVEIARERWGGEGGARFYCDEAVRFLTGCAERFDAVYSRFGALWFSDPQQWAPLVHKVLTDRSVLVFSCAEPVAGCYGAQGMYGNGFWGPRNPVQRWAYTPEMWEGLLWADGFLTVDSWVLEAPEPGNVGTLIVQARKL